MKDIKDRAILITGSTDGIGKETSRGLAAEGASLLLHGRNDIKLTRTAGEIRKATGNERIKTYLADLSSLTQVRRLAADVQKDNDRLDALINNAAIGFGVPPFNRREVSADGHELRFAVNYLAPYLLTNLLLPLLRSSAPSRIVNVASIGQEAIDFGDVMLEKEYGGIRAYRQSKTALVMFTFDLAERLTKNGVTVDCLHPATYMDTNMVRDAGVTPRNTVQTGVDALLYIATAPGLDGVTGRFFNQKEEDRAIGQAYDVGARQQLRRLSEKLTGVKTPQ
jgi:NAD(P)-dependent dehydrogenase (short-subunit alcohol dehydrogenase family)